MKGSEQVSVNSEQVSANSEQVSANRRMGKVVVLPKVWAVGEKKPCGSAGVVGWGEDEIAATASVQNPVRGDGSVAHPSGEPAGERNTVVSPLRRFAPPVEMTVRGDGSCAPVEMTGKDLRGASGTGEYRTADSSASLRNDKQDLGTAEAEEALPPAKLEVAFYRKYTEAMLRRYAVMSLEAGRVPSMLGREMFRGKVTSYRVSGFDDAVNFCLDVESCLRRLSKADQFLVKRIGVQQYTHGEAALMLGVSLRTGITRYGEALDRLTRTFLKERLLEPQTCCQEGARPLIRVSRCK